MLHLRLRRDRDYRTDAESEVNITPVSKVTVEGVYLLADGERVAEYDDAYGYWETVGRFRKPHCENSECQDCGTVTHAPEWRASAEWERWYESNRFGSFHITVIDYVE
jgi:hypothetical protein